MDVFCSVAPTLPHAEPNNDSPLNTQAAALWANQEGMRFFMSHRELCCFQKVCDGPVYCCSETFVLDCSEFRKMVEKLYKPAA
jgi:hypothetical protein